MGREAHATSPKEARSTRSRQHLKRDRIGAHNSLVSDYFAENPLYNEDQFQRRFRMSRRLFLQISGDLEREYTFLNKKWMHGVNSDPLRCKNVPPPFDN
ncbi:hypothetical protein HanRHA438_Chr08g0370991 [Helianthus annuus]|uniref:Harbinger transposase-derived protein n=1 Tax=Helianthus annuus TaxID=4232 RepID=A0A9K3IIB4_HELAN|nr:hypothetical protein HanXRQr2_Chr08g0358911 [Helianthus annuus]KAJ0540272.1 hypothetical protein HanHA300_Chr08g0296361 [Helianthus annuus]KAJ0548772.1 hypothetical protein HanIR_Chr08g0387551 [Helianthus annuus]KAJ0555016.1 hypothetical protein HanHA89_Chr08g0314871 [Helianthus annuus]KAJ0720584.1 hypothetical protein HanLR1_Chr08g0295231 [Helianthus annuus]